MPERLSFGEDGAQHHPGAAGSALPHLIASLEAPGDRRPGIRIDGHAATALRPWLEATGPIGRIAALTLGPHARPVRAVLFDKSPAANWGLGWHQDRVICVRERREVAGFTVWTVKQGLLHVAPPFAVIAAMVTLRVHLDPVPPTNAPLRISPGSHRLGRIVEADIPAVVADCGEFSCLAEAGDVWCYATPILHASSPSVQAGTRRVLQVDYSAQMLPSGLEWAGL